jgi:regulator of protease activity HflC (stomatin/prohibitin superfamily)
MNPALWNKAISGTDKALSAKQRRSGIKSVRSTTMWVIRKFIVKKNECGLLFKNGDFVRFLDAGTYHFLDPLRKIEVEVFDLSVPEFTHRLTDLLIKQFADEVAKRFGIVELNATQVALITKNGRLAYVLAPSTRTLFWKGLVDVEAKVIDIADDFTIESRLAAELAYANQGLLRDSALAAIYCKLVPEYRIGVLYVDGDTVKTLVPGLHAYWKFNRNIRIELFDTRVQDMDVAGQEILTKDKVNLRINLSCSYQITDVMAATSKLSDVNDYVRRELQFGLRAAVGTRTLDALLEDKSAIDESVLAHIKAKTADVGISIADVGVKDIILPGDMKTILAQVVEAEKAAQANSIRRREETAATRSMLNTAKVMEDNPTALRLKELETLEKITENVGNLSVFGGLEGLMNGLVKIK